MAVSFCNDDCLFWGSSPKKGVDAAHAVDPAHAVVATSDSIKWFFPQPHPPWMDVKVISCFSLLNTAQEQIFICDSCAQISCGKMLRCRITCVSIIHSKGGWRWVVLELQTSRLGAS